METLLFNIPSIAQVDSYKFGHFAQYDPKIKYMSSYIESRGTDRDWKDMVVAGVEYVKHLMAQPIVTPESLELMKIIGPHHGPTFNAEGWEYILNIHNGIAPIEISAIAEGTVVPLGTPIVQIRNTDPKVPWLVSYVETKILRAIWYMSTVATQSMQIKRVMKKYLLQTAGHTEGLDWMLHDFGARGVSSSESAALGGLAHLYSFNGSDTFEANFLANFLYGTEMAGYSIDASEHSIMTSYPTELEAFETIIDKFSVPNKTFALVSDSYNLWEAIQYIIGGKLKTKVENLGTMGSRLVVRPDSGDPLTVVVKAIEMLMDAFGYTKNDKGYKVLPAYIRVIQGDGVNEHSIEKILERMEVSNLSAENVVFGMGGALLQQVNRDTLKFAMKTSAASYDGDIWFPVFKDPIDDKGKTSKKGLQMVDSDFNVTSTLSTYTVDLETSNYSSSILRNIDFHNSTLEEIRERVKQGT